MSSDVDMESSDDAVTYTMNDQRSLVLLALVGHFKAVVPSIRMWKLISVNFRALFDDDETREYITPDTAKNLVADLLELSPEKLSNGVDEDTLQLAWNERAEARQTELEEIERALLPLIKSDSAKPPVRPRAPASTADPMTDEYWATLDVPEYFRADNSARWPYHLSLAQFRSLMEQGEQYDLAASGEQLNADKQAILTALMGGKYNSLFIAPVDTAQYPVYDNFVLRPTCYGDVQKSIGMADGATLEMMRDLTVIFANCLVFNHAFTELGRQAAYTRRDMFSIMSETWARGQ
ncbi:Bromodomain [Carpediemonas membranifera]|uniref:Bromodomain n=1 Tax=Carpediemonas membranifera TaxID=201153 RepID=A0A8J6B227_9EUKA|nr:Bromodomain [Carpediemonas membranifera]|eukprot:KAG9391322.1 Bromodomain [Carpediemonas membranifera]